MDENQKENEANESISTESTNVGNDIKQETVNTFNEAKEKMKNIDFKAEAETGKGLLKKLIKNPFEAIKETAQDSENNFFKTAILLVAIWAIIAFVKQLLYYITSKYAKFSGENILSLIKITIAPICRILALTLSVYIVNKKSKKSFITIITTMTVAKIPVIISSLLGFLTYISHKVTYITNPIGSLLSIISTVLVYFAVKSLSNEENDSDALKAFIKVEAVYYIIYFALSFLDISL